MVRRVTGVTRWEKRKRGEKRKKSKGVRSVRVLRSKKRKYSE